MLPFIYRIVYNIFSKVCRWTSHAPSSVRVGEHEIVHFILDMEAGAQPVLGHRVSAPSVQTGAGPRHLAGGHVALRPLAPF